MNPSRFPPIIDAHCHLDAFGDGAALALQRARGVGVCEVICAGVSPKSWALQAKLSQAHRGVHLALGIHPWTLAPPNPSAPRASKVGVADTNTEALEERVSEMLEALDSALDSTVGVVGIGEVGLDRSKRVAKGSLELQKRCLRAQLGIARERDLPVVLHTVRAHGALLEILKKDGLPQQGGVIHGFMGPAEMVREYARLGLYFSLGGAVFQKNPRVLRAAVEIPLERLLIETDAPDGLGASSLDLLPQVLQRLADIRHENIEALAKQTAWNTRRLFRI